jgi:hypothetical protein
MPASPDPAAGTAQDRLAQPWPPEVWALRYTGPHEDQVSLHASRDHAIAQLAQHARASWDNVGFTPGVPPDPAGLSDEEAVQVYFAAREGLEGYTLYGDEVGGRTDPGHGNEPDPRPVEELVRRAEAAGIGMLALFDEVHDTASLEGSRVNNAGVGAQIRYLTENGFGLTEIAGLLGLPYPDPAVSSAP